ncbi:DinB family protein [Ethanoligenens harbinense]|uniref:DinB-like domain-containing protein n=1 Tax=Ethanoligenens harbinense (strain DSM 18485 / JCM 12961 / CGMCC 1.5033 / YUAN-3) TaxID=663278 RepID=E6U9X3_ETHHY|nr:DinB family protein [Ethanoligenens harbinense]ADU26239.1 hypothetical protein Ethha_0670 [Ethanoligenens harbinense YUAN-3]AVQ95374.1 hypothetical protein CXQ68_03440 [Ethanoligenens harbinense YUAN-3]AYF38040.1 hypothetical protein CXP51_03305 [Ethanoligenens harbinense]AYF40785.1 hypothetical protein CN246_03440 [Ethanoligenens harbinense]QCN91616.1 hypothetical protein DRA42_03445 [Ethanoligenens harbinense]
MSRELVTIIEEQTRILLHNVDILLQTCEPDAVLCDMPVWKHAYHMLHSLDRWFVNPERYEEPAFHAPGLNSLDIASENALTREQLRACFFAIRQKVTAYLATLTDGQLSTKPEGCPHTRLALILGQYRHLNAHLGNINAVTMMRTGRWPRVVGLDGGLDQGLYE